MLLVNAGMVPFKPYFLGQRKPPADRLATAQKCVRTPDIDEVGKTTRHATFFQMLGNFSIGDYFKAEVIPFAWELLTKPESEGGFGFPPDRLWATVYLDDDEALDIWHNKVGLPLERIQRRGLEDNYWHMGVPGPGGPCSEIYYDRGAEYGREGGPIADENRYLEVWNLVFMQDQLGEVRARMARPPASCPQEHRHRHGPGAHGGDPPGRRQHLPTTPPAESSTAADLTETRYRPRHRVRRRLRSSADHVRTGTTMVADGVGPGNEAAATLRRICAARSAT